jgi:hypothetical protein
MSKKILYSLEYPVRCSPTILFDFLTNPTGLQEWFADRVDEHDSTYTFWWNSNPEKALLVDSEFERFVRYRWEYQTEEEYFEFRIDRTEISNQTILVIKDFADKKELKDAQQLWDFQVKELLHRLGN